MEAIPNNQRQTQLKQSQNQTKDASRQWIKHFVNLRQKNRALISSTQTNISSKLNSITDILKLSLQTPPIVHTQIPFAQRQQFMHKIRHATSKSSKLINSKTIKHNPNNTVRKITQENDQMYLRKLSRMVQGVDAWELSSFAQWNKSKGINKNIRNQHRSAQEFQQQKKICIQKQNRMQKMPLYEKCGDYNPFYSQPNICQAQLIEKLNQQNEKLRSKAQNLMGIKFDAKSKRNAIHNKIPKFYHEEQQRLSPKFSNIYAAQKESEYGSGFVQNKYVPACFMEILKPKKLETNILLQAIRRGYKTACSSRRIRYVGV